jgi:hypothetical protein
MILWFHSQFIVLRSTTKKKVQEEVKSFNHKARCIILGLSSEQLKFLITAL